MSGDKRSEMDPNSDSLYGILGIPVTTSPLVPKDSAILYAKGGIVHPPNDGLLFDLADYRQRLYDDRIVAMLYATASMRTAAYVIPSGFRARVREWWRLTGRGHALQHSYSWGDGTRADWIHGADLLNRAWCVLLGRHRWSYTATTAKCVECNATRSLPKLAVLTNLV